MSGSAERSPSPAQSRVAHAALTYRRTCYVRADVHAAFAPLLQLGGARGWYYADRLWRLRAWLDRLSGGPGAVRDSGPLEPGRRVGLWIVDALDPPRELSLFGVMRVPGVACLRFDVEPLGAGASVTLIATLRTASWVGRLYWWMLYPVHVVVFRGMLRALSREAEVLADSARPKPIVPRRPASRPVQRERPSPCIAGCPNGTDIRGWITTIAQRRRFGLSDEQAYELAWRKIVDVNPFPSVTGRICPHPCETGCNRSGKDGAVSVKELERFVGDWAIARRLPLRCLEGESGTESIGVVGSGPAGLSFAYQMARRGYPVTVYERQEQAGGMLRYGIPVYRLPPAVLDAEIGRIVDLGVELRTGIRIGDGVTLERLRAAHAAMFVGIGAPLGRPLGIPGEQGPGVWSATDWLDRAHRGVAPPLGAHVVVIGGGDTAFDAARMARRAGAEVVVAYRRSRDEMPAAGEEIEEALAEGVRIEFLAGPVAVEREGERPTAVRFRRMTLVDTDGSGRRGVRELPGTDFTLAATAVIAAVSRGPDWGSLSPRYDGRPQVEGDGRIDGAVWTGGDALGPGIASAAIAHGRRAAEEVHARLRGLPPPPRQALEPVGPQDVHLDGYLSQARSVPAQRPSSAWIQAPDAEIHQGIDEARFLEEVERCLSCGTCFGCERCFIYCAHGCFTRIAEPGPGRYFALSLDACQSCGKCVDLCPCGHLGDAAAPWPPSA